MTLEAKDSSIRSRIARLLAFGVGVACIGGALFVPVDSLLPISDMGQRLWGAGGIVGGITLGWIGQHILHRPMTRFAVIPGGVLGGTTLVLLVASRVAPLGDLRTIAGLMLTASLLVSCGLRAAWYGLRGRADLGPNWGSELPEDSRAGEKIDQAAYEDALRLARYVGRPPSQAQRDLRLVKDEQALRRRAADQ